MSGKIKSGGKKLVYGAIVALSLLTTGVIEVSADIITWHYEDDFSTTKAETDTYDHTFFFPIMSYHPLPALCYWPEKGILVFQGRHFPEDEPAFLPYAFPLDNVLTRVDCGVFELAVSFSSESPFPTYLSYQLSENGVDWTEPSALVEGHNIFCLLPSGSGTTYIKLFGGGVSIDNLSVTICGPKTPDLYHNYYVDLFDFAVLASQWLQAPGVPSADLAPDMGDGVVDANDLAILAKSWLDCYVTPARGPYPRDNATDVNLRPVLRWWSASDGALYHDVYFGTDANAVTSADRSSTQFMGRVSNTTFGDLYMLEPGTRYYWRIDEVGTACTRPGDVWNFRTLIE
jgi:hypothetical protein